MNHSIQHNVLSFLAFIALVCVEAAYLPQDASLQDLKKVVPTLVSVIVFVGFGFRGSMGFILPWVLYRTTEMGLQSTTLQWCWVFLGEAVIPSALGVLVQGRRGKYEQTSTDYAGSVEYIRLLEGKLESQVSKSSFLEKQIQHSFSSPAEILPCLTRMLQSTSYQEAFDGIIQLVRHTIPDQACYILLQRESRFEVLATDGTVNQSDEFRKDCVPQDLEALRAVREGRSLWRFKATASEKRRIEVVLTLTQCIGGSRLVLFLPQVHFLNCNRTTKRFLDELPLLADTLLNSVGRYALPPDKSLEILGFDAFRRVCRHELTRQHDGVADFVVVRIDLVPPKGDLLAVAQLQWRLALHSLRATVRPQDVVATGSSPNTYFCILHATRPVAQEELAPRIFRCLQAQRISIHRTLDQQTEIREIFPEELDKELILEALPSTA